MESIVFEINEINKNKIDTKENNVNVKHDELEKNNNKNDTVLKNIYTSKKPLKIVENIYYFN